MSERIATVQDLIAAREARGFAPEDVMRQLKLHPRQLHALEAGDWHALPGQAFVRGVLRGYGRMLEVDVEPLVEAMSATLHAADLRPAASLDEPLPSRSMLGFGSGGSGSRVAWILLLAAGVLVLAFFFGGSDLGGVGSWLSRENAVETARARSPRRAPSAVRPERPPRRFPSASLHRSSQAARRGRAHRPRSPGRRPSRVRRNRPGHRRPQRRRRPARLPGLPRRTRPRRRRQTQPGPATRAPPARCCG